MNTQEPTKRSNNIAKLLVHSIFHTIQGEGCFSGRAATFLRLGGCNLQCPGCDTEYTDGSKELTWQLVRDRINSQTNELPVLVVITGGEPLRQNLVPLINALHRQGTVVQIETNGSMPIMDYENLENAPYVVCSPKTSKLNPITEKFITHYKYVIDHQHINLLDGLPTTVLNHNASPMVARPHDNYTGEIFITPMDMTEHYKPDTVGVDVHDSIVKYNKANMEMCVTIAKTFGYVVQLQIHKHLNVE